MTSTVVVTGASSGVGRAVARRFAEPGVTVVLLARGVDALEGAAAEVERLGAQALLLSVDVADAEAAEEAATIVEERVGPIDVWINAAMTTVFGFFDDIEPDELRRATEVTYLGSVWGIRSALRRMLPRDRGTIVQVGSAIAYRGIPLQAPYSGAKHGVQGVVESVRCELRHRGSQVRLTTVHLPGVNTPQFEHCRNRFDHRSQPVPPVYQPEVAADAIHWAARHPRRREVWVGAPTAWTIVASRLVPGLLEAYLARTAVSGQLDDAPHDPDSPGNLDEPVPGDRGAHGPYDDRARARALRPGVVRRVALAAAGAVAVAASPPVRRRAAGLRRRSRWARSGPVVPAPGRRGRLARTLRSSPR